MQNSECVNVCFTNKNVLHLSDEVLIHICTYVSSEDLISLSFSCTRFNELLCERKLIGNLNLRAAYSVKLPVLKSFLQPIMRCHKVHTVSLASCYWLISSDILWAVQRFINLKRLDVEDTNLSIQHLTRILKSNELIESVSWTFHMTNKVTVSDIRRLNEQFHRMKSLNISVKGYAVSLVPLLLCECFNLEELKLSSYKYRDIPAERTHLLRAINLENVEKYALPNIKSLILNMPDRLESGWLVFITRLCFTFLQTSDWHCLWLHVSYASLISALRRNSSIETPININNLYALSTGVSQEELLHTLESKYLKYFKYKEKSPGNGVDFQISISKITHLCWESNSIPISLPVTLQHLHIPCTCVRLKKPLILPVSYDPLVHLTRLSIPICTFTECLSDPCQCPQVEAEDKWLAPRKSHLRKAPHENCLLKIFSEIAPNIQELEMKCPLKCLITPGPRELSSLAIISRWLNLQSLFLENISIIDISFLREVCTQCSMLRRLGLINVRIPQTKELVDAINMLQNLEDFILEQPIFDKLLDITNALSGCPKLRRVCLICERTNTKQDMKSYLNLIEQCKQLVFLFVRVASITQKMKKDFQKEFKKRFANDRVALWASLEGTVNDDFWETIPSVHCYEMIVDPALLSVMPPFHG